MATSTPKRTRVDAVYDALRADVLAGRRPPGERLKFPDLSAAYGASVSVIREALTRLAAEGMVTSQAHLGFTVTELSADSLGDLTDARLVLESLVLERSIAEGDVGWESEVVATHHRLERTPLLSEDEPVRVSDEWVQAHAAFHAAILAGCANKRLVQMTRALRDEAELYRRWSLPLGLERDRDLAGEHRRIMELTLARDAAGAAAALRDHIAHTTRLLDEYIATAT
ncbi:GntR family transcriptional regulator [Tsukamurella sp. PLM1]|uniref:GntR family transcriptional regulator n=1 Tax=Tsukamurella sp. PLM1 TaxID=2929795 RepID=UPI0020521A03|nr:FCD domain-containing protein [Tsukamurella sp. PLM1]BDH59561.1 GntR family transcriptional regulator [Tsukamurella sp. PLM1]